MLLGSRRLTLLLGHISLDRLPLCSVPRESESQSHFWRVSTSFLILEVVYPLCGETVIVIKNTYSCLLV